MTEFNFFWDVNGNDTQTFMLGNIQQHNKDEVYGSNYIVNDCIPGIPYSIQATITNALTDESSEFSANEGKPVWFESNISEISFTKDHANLINFTLSEVSGTEINVNVTHTLNSYPDLISYTLKYELYAESICDPQCVTTYDLAVTEIDQYFPISELTSNTEYDVYYSLLVNPNDSLHNEWYYVYTHQHIGVISTPVTGNIHFDNQELANEFICQNIP
jgi:hypothetical protein